MLLQQSGQFFPHDFSQSLFIFFMFEPLLFNTVQHHGPNRPRSEIAILVTHWFASEVLKKTVEHMCNILFILPRNKR